MRRLRARARRGVRPGDDDPGARSASASRSPVRARRSTWRTSPRSATQPGRAAVPGRPRASSVAARAEAAAAALRDEGGARRRRHRVGLRPHRGARSSRWRGVHDTDEELADTEGGRVPGVELKVVKLDGTVAGAGRGGRDPRQGPAADARATSTRRSTPRRSTRRATSAPATSASLDERRARRRSPAG